MTAQVDLEPVIGLEVHAQLLTRSKMFCGCSSEYAGAAPNSHCCAVCLGMPGSLPVINERALDYGLMTALALHCHVADQTKFDRKNYSYPDVPKGYQISQYDDPIGRDGWLEYSVNDQIVRWGIIRVHLEEDTGKTTHTTVNDSDVSLVDYNRSGVPLMEIVTTPEARSPEDARELFEALRQVLMYLGVNDGNLQEGSMRADVNISLRIPGGPPGTKVEIKNLNSFRAVQRALEYEIRRQTATLASGGAVEQETRGWSEQESATLPQRTKEYAEDYRYFPEPDLPPLVVPVDRLDRLGESLPELPAAKRTRFGQQYALSTFHSRVLTRERALADYFESAASGAAHASPAAVANWVTGDFLRLLAEQGGSVEATPVPPARLGRLASMVESREISGAAGKQVLEEMFRSDEEPEAVVDRLNLRQVADRGALDGLVTEVLDANPGLVDTYRKGKTNVIQALVGQTMKASRGKADPALVREILEQKLR